MTRLSSWNKTMQTENTVKVTGNPAKNPDTENTFDSKPPKRTESKQNLEAMHETETYQFKPR